MTSTHIDRSRPRAQPPRTAATVRRRLALGASGLGASVLAAWALAGAALARPPVTIADPAVFLVQRVCPDGRLEVHETGCAGARPQTAADPLTERKGDFPAPLGFTRTDGLWLGGNRYETIWSFRPFGPFTPQKGDGGEVYVIEGHTVRAAVTQDGGKPWLQAFLGAHCGGDGWVVFRDDAPTGDWARTVARLDGKPYGSPCSIGGEALTRYRLEAVELPFFIDRQLRRITLRTVISEHYNWNTIFQSRAMERTFFAEGVGRVIWEAWTTGEPLGRHLEERCPGTAWSTPPAEGWRLSDCRYATNLKIDRSGLTGAAWGWPPPIDRLP